MVTLPQVSVPVAVPVAEGSVGLVHSTVASAGIVKEGYGHHHILINQKFRYHLIFLNFLKK